MSHPFNAEQFPILTFYHSIEVESQLAAPARQRRYFLICPGCAVVHPDPPALQEIECDCGIMWEVVGATLYVWRRGRMPKVSGLDLLKKIVEESSILSEVFPRKASG